MPSRSTATGRFRPSALSSSGRTPSSKAVDDS
jgi:hypothetical protein